MPDAVFILHTLFSKKWYMYISWFWCHHFLRCSSEFQRQFHWEWLIISDGPTSVPLLTRCRLGSCLVSLCCWLCPVECVPQTSCTRPSSRECREYMYKIITLREVILYGLKCWNFQMKDKDILVFNIVDIKKKQKEGKVAFFR